jgi:hypothetical protein
MIFDYSDPLHPHNKYGQFKPNNNFGEPEMFCWPASIEIVEGRYAKRLITNRFGNQNHYLVPLFYRRGLNPSSELLCTNTIPTDLLNQHAMRPALFELDLEVSEIHVVKNSDLLDQLSLIPRSRNQIYSWKSGQTTFLADATTLIEALIASDEPLFRLLLSPFRGAVVEIRTLPGQLVIFLRTLDCAMPRRFKSPPSDLQQKLRAAGKCLLHWLTSSEHSTQLSLCAASILAQQPLHVPTFQARVSAEIVGYRLGNEVLVRQLRVPRRSELCTAAPTNFSLICQQQRAYQVVSSPTGSWAYPGMLDADDLRQFGIDISVLSAPLS